MWWKSCHVLSLSSIPSSAYFLSPYLWEINFPAVFWQIRTLWLICKLFLFFLLALCELCLTYWRAPYFQTCHTHPFQGCRVFADRIIKSIPLCNKSKWREGCDYATGVSYHGFSLTKILAVQCKVFLCVSQGALGKEPTVVIAAVSWMVPVVPLFIL